MKKLAAEIARMNICHLREFHDNPRIGLSMREELFLQALEIALPVLEQQESTTDIYRQIENDGWIEWRGNGPTVALLGKTVKVRYQDNDTDVGPSSHFYWFNNCGNPIIAYRVIGGEACQS